MLELFYLDEFKPCSDLMFKTKVRNTCISTIPWYMYGVNIVLSVNTGM